MPFTVKHIWFVPLFSATHENMGNTKQYGIISKNEYIFIWVGRGQHVKTFELCDKI